MNKYMINSFAFVIPIHPPHYHYIYNLINKVEFDNIDLFLIFSNTDDYNNFNEKDRIKPIIIPNNIHTKNIVTFKKFYALKHHLIHTNYDSFIICDSEIGLIYENFNITNMLKSINTFFDNKLIYAGETPQEEIHNIIYNSSNIFDNYNKEKLKEITNNFTLYSWWSNMPIYKREHIAHFFDTINDNNINWFHFDHLIYTFYLLLYHSFNIINITHIIGNRWSMESYNTDNIEHLIILEQNKYSFDWITLKLFDKFKDHFINRNCLLLYHLDR